MIKNFIDKRVKKVADSYFGLSERANSVRNNFDTKNIVNADNVFFAPNRRISPWELENIYLSNPFVNECIVRTVEDIYKNDLNIILPKGLENKTDEFYNSFWDNYGDYIKKHTLDLIVYGGSLALKQDFNQPPTGKYKLSKATNLVYIPYSQYQGIPNFVLGTSIIDGAKIWNVGTAGSVDKSFAISFTNLPVPYSKQEIYKYQGMGIIESKLVMIKLAMVILDSLANTTFRNGALTIKVKGNHDAMRSQDKDKLVQFFSNIKLINDGINSTAMTNVDTEEDITTIEFDLSKYDDILNTTIQFLCGLFGYSATSILGASPKGFQATGDSEKAMNAENIKRYQSRLYSPIKEILKIEAFKFFGKEVDVDFEFNNPIAMSRQEEAEVQQIEISNALNLQSVQSLEALDYLYQRDVISADEYERKKNDIEQFNQGLELDEENTSS